MYLLVTSVSHNSPMSAHWSQISDLGGFMSDEVYVLTGLEGRESEYKVR